MRAKTVLSIAYCFDFDECLVTTTARINIFRNGTYYKSMNSKEYSLYQRRPGDKLDFSEFDDGEYILDAKPYKVWHIIKHISDAIKSGRKFATIYVLTARSLPVRPYIYEFLKSHGIDIEIEHILTIGDSIGKINIAKEKRKVLATLNNKYDNVVFYDDDLKNIKIAQSITPEIKTRLIEKKLIFK